MIMAPDNTGFMIKNKDFAPIITTIGSAPAGGWVVPVSCIMAIASPTPKAMEYQLLPNK